jgi:hypothetical protein
MIKNTMMPVTWKETKYLAWYKEGLVIITWGQAMLYLVI